MFVKTIDKKLKASIFFVAIFICTLVVGTFTYLQTRYAANLTSESYRTSAEQLAEGIAFPLKIRDISTVIRNSTRTFIAKKSIFMTIKDFDNILVFEEPEALIPKIGINECKENYTTLPVLFGKEKVGEISYCYSTLSTKFTTEFFLKFFIYIVPIVLIIGSLIYFLLHRNNKPLYDFLASINEIDPSHPDFAQSAPRSVQEDKDILQVYQNVFLLIENIQRVSREREEANKYEAIGQMTQMFAHDVRKPFGSMRMILEYLKKTQSLPSDIRDFLDASCNNVTSYMNSIDAMIDDIMEITSKGKYSFAECCPNDVINGAMEKINFVIPENKVEVVYELSDKTKIMANQEKLERVFVNIILNAFQAMNNIGKIWLRSQKIVKQSEASLLFCIGNSGSHISQENLDKIFEQFYSNGKAKGTGLGLAIAKKIVELHKGKIWCISVKDVGVEFYFTIPLFIENAENEIIAGIL